MKEKEVAKLFKTIADSFTRLSEIYSSTEDMAQPKAPAKKEKPTQTEKVSEAVQEGSPETITYTKEDVRARLAQKAKADAGKYKADVKKIVATFSSDGTLTGVPADKYPEVIAALEVIGNA